MKNNHSTCYDSTVEVSMTNIVMTGAQLDSEEDGCQKLANAE